MKCIEAGCDEEGNHKIRTLDGNIIWVCDKHLKGWPNCEEIPPLTKRIQNKKVVIATVLIAIVAVGVIPAYFFLLRPSEPEHVTPTPPGARVGVKAGDWIKCDYKVTGWPSGTPYPEWLKVEILSVEGTTATVRVTMHMSDGAEQSDTLSVDVVAGGGTFDTLFGFVILANSKVGDSINMGGDGFTFTVTIDGETTRTYAGARRTVVYTSFSQYGAQLTYYWDKQTGVMVEASVTSVGMTGTAKATETNMWEAVPPPFWMQWWLWAIVAVVIVALAGAVHFLKKRKPPTPTAPPLPLEGTV